MLTKTVFSAESISVLRIDLPQCIEITLVPFTQTQKILLNYVVYLSLNADFHSKPHRDMLNMSMI